MSAPLITMRDVIENMTKFNQVEILRILYNSKSVTLNENKYGVHVNLSDVDENILSDLNNYIGYVTAQENTLKQDELQKEDIKNNYFS